MSLLVALGALAPGRCFIVYRLVPKPDSPKADKVPVDPATLRNSDAQNPANWMTAAEALAHTARLGAGHGIGIVLTEGGGLWCLDLDEALEPSGQWSAWAQAACQRFPGAYVEVSVSGRGLHIMGRATVIPNHGTRCAPLKSELYSKHRFIALTGLNAVGDPNSDHTAALGVLASEYFPPRPEAPAADWTHAPVPQWRGPADDATLVNRALRSHGAGAVFGGKAAFIDLWLANADKLSRTFPSATGDVWDRSAADQAFANHLAFWTGSDCERMARIMLASGLVRPKWEREEYFRGTILGACATQKQWYKDPTFAQSLTGQESARPPDRDEPVASVSAHAATAAAAVSLPGPAALPTPSAAGASTPTPAAEGSFISGVDIPTAHKVRARESMPPGAIAGIDEQKLMFDGCVYVEDINQVMMPDGTSLDKARFDNRFPGVTFTVTIDGQKPTMSAWEAFVQSQMYTFPRVRGLYFAPGEPTGAVLEKEGLRYINSWVPVEIPATPGDYSPFWNHLKKLLPNGRDAEVLLYWMAAAVQHQGTKFLWWPFIQGVEGNGKSFVCEFLQQCVGSRYTHASLASKIGSKFNAAFYGKIFFRVDEVKLSHQQGDVWETLKSMITQTVLEIEPKGVDAVNRDVCFNGVLLSNYKNGIRKSENDRRLAPFFCAQQTKADLLAQGMIDDASGETSQYFDSLWDWAKNQNGWAITNWFLRNIQIPPELNPAGRCVRAPNTTSTFEAITEGMGSAEQEILEAIGAGHDGFRGGWVSSGALDRLLARMGKENAIPRQRRAQVLTALGYVPHPGLAAHGGRTPVRMPDGSMPILYLKAGHQAQSLTSALEAVQAFNEAQKLK